MNRTENVYDDCVSVYDIGDHSDYSFKFGDVVFRLADEQNEENSEGGKEEVKATCGQVRKGLNENKSFQFIECILARIRYGSKIQCFDDSWKLDLPCKVVLSSM